MKEKILKLKKQGKTYNQIAKELQCSKSTVCYHCGSNQKEKTIARTNKFRAKNKIATKIHAFTNKKLRDASRDFQRRIGSKNHSSYLKSKSNRFNFNDVIKKFGIETYCYLSGEKINLLKDNNYSFDHIIPTSRHGDNSIENLGIVHRRLNRMKNDFMVDELLDWCIKILKFNGYKVNK